MLRGRAGARDRERMPVGVGVVHAHVQRRLHVFLELEGVVDRVRRLVRPRRAASRSGGAGDEAVDEGGRVEDVVAGIEDREVEDVRPRRDRGTHVQERRRAVVLAPGFRDHPLGREEGAVHAHQLAGGVEREVQGSGDLVPLELPGARVELGQETVVEAADELRELLALEGEIEGEAVRARRDAQVEAQDGDVEGAAKIHPVVRAGAARVVRAGRERHVARGEQGTRPALRREDGRRRADGAVGMQCRAGDPALARDDAADIDGGRERRAGLERDRGRVRAAVPSEIV